MRLVSPSRVFELSGRVLIVAALNATPDSYYVPSRTLDPDVLAAKAKQAVSDGADILEVGGESTGPGSIDVSLEEELERVIPSIQAVRKALPDTWISVDTWKADVAEAAIAAGADMINDITSGRGDHRMFSVITAANVPYVMMYSKDRSPRTTVSDRTYDDVVAEIHAFLHSRITAAREAGIRQIIVDPGLGHFVSSVPKYSHEILRRLREFSNLGPVFVSPSRKSFLAGSLQLSAKDRLPATLAATAIAAVNGASFVRTHDVKETREILDGLARLMLFTGTVAPPPARRRS